MDWKSYCLTFVDKLERQYLAKTGRHLDIRHPQTFTETIQWMKIYDSSFLKAYCADKITLHDYSIKKLGYDLCIPLLATYENPADINWDNLPNQFVIKCNHGSGYNIIVTDKNKIDKIKVIEQLNSWLKTDYGTIGYELHYNLIHKKVLIEEYKANDGQPDLIDYKLFCFNGVPKFWQVITDRSHNEHISHYDMNWQYSPVYDWKKYDSINNIPKPSHYDMMVDVANILNKDFNFVRVDFYIINDTVFLGELTFTPADGYQTFKFNNADLLIGNFLSL